MVASPVLQRTDRSSDVDSAISIRQKKKKSSPWNHGAKVNGDKKSAPISLTRGVVRSVIEILALANDDIICPNKCNFGPTGAPR